MVARSFSGVWRRETTLFIEPLCVFCIVLISEFDNEKKATSDPEIKAEKIISIIITANEVKAWMLKKWTSTPWKIDNISDMGTSSKLKII